PSPEDWSQANQLGTRSFGLAERPSRRRGMTGHTKSFRRFEPPRASTSRGRQQKLCRLLASSLTSVPTTRSSWSCRGQSALALAPALRAARPRPRCTLARASRTDQLHPAPLQKLLQAGRVAAAPLNQARDDDETNPQPSSCRFRSRSSAEATGTGKGGADAQVAAGEERVHLLGEHLGALLCVAEGDRLIEQLFQGADGEVGQDARFAL